MSSSSVRKKPLERRRLGVGSSSSFEADLRFGSQEVFVTLLRKMMLEELHHPNYADEMIRHYIRLVETYRNRNWTFYSHGGALSAVHNNYPAICLPQQQRSPIARYPSGCELGLYAARKMGCKCEGFLDTL